MKIPLVFALGSLALASSCPAEGGGAAMFPRSDLMTIGVYYYPEAWPESQWARDIANIKKMHLEFVHMGEFAWAFMEPEEGQFDFAWLDRAVQLCADQGLKVVLCTPSPTPPVWLRRRTPKSSWSTPPGRRMLHGTRQQATWSSDVSELRRAIVDAELASATATIPRSGAGSSTTSSAITAPGWTTARRPRPSSAPG
jgi:hypothetical protein